MSKYDSMTDEQRRAIVEAAIAMAASSLAPSECWATPARAVVDAVRDAECPTWSVEGDRGSLRVVSSHGDVLYVCHGVNRTIGLPEACSVLAAALTSHEREKRGLK